MKLTPKINCAAVTKLQYTKFDDEAGAVVGNYLDLVKDYYIKLYNAYSNAKENLIAKLNKTDADREQFLQMQNEYFNENLSDLTRNRNSADRIIEIGGELIQRADPVFLDPPASNFLRAHFYAPRKAICGKYYDTYWVNMAVVWIMTIAFFVTLYLDAWKNVWNKIIYVFSQFYKSNAQSE